MKSEIKVQDIELFLSRLDKALQANKVELDRIETVIWKKENSLALFWNKHFGKWYAMEVYDKELVAKHSIRYGFQRWDLQEAICKQEQLKERLKYAIQSNSSVVFEDSDYRLLSGG
jgi:hypothetical protein